MTLRTLSKTSARQLAVTRQHLSGKPPKPSRAAILEIVRDLGCLQLDPISAVARSHLLVLWSRLGVYDPADVERLLFEDRALFEYWAHVASIVLTEDYPVHHWRMKQYGRGEGEDTWSDRVRDWLAQNQPLYDFILAELSEKGALMSRQLELDDKVSNAWVSSGWTNGRNVGQMIDFLWGEGKIMVSGRSGGQKVWDLTERCFPDWAQHEAWDEGQVVGYAAQKAIRALGIATIQQIKVHYTRGRYPNLPAVLQTLEAAGTIQRVAVENLPGTWYIHTDDLPLLDRIEAGEFQPRTVLLSPFDNLICDRARTEALWDFYFRIEIYVPANKRQYGYYVLPILHGDQLIGRVDPQYDRKTKILHINNLYAEPKAPARAASAIRKSIESLAAFLGAQRIVYGNVADVWRGKIENA
jgi:uncharacterized protein YcaQ